MAGVALGDIAPQHSSFAWQAWHLDTSTFILRGRRGTYGIGLASGGALGSLVAGDAAALCVAGVALGDIHLRLRGRRGTWRHLPWFCVAGVGLAHGAGSGGGLVALGSPVRGRRGTW